MGRLRELLDELHARQVAARVADDASAVDDWTGEGGATAAPQRVSDESASRPASSTSSGTTDSA
jgi:hypothetical protein